MSADIGVGVTFSVSSSKKLTKCSIFLFDEGMAAAERTYVGVESRSC